MPRKGFIKIDRKLLTWRWYKEPNTMRVFIHLLLTANIAESELEGIKIERGQVATSYASLAESLGLSVKNMRTAINHLKSTGEVATKQYSKFQVITIQNYDEYQKNGRVSGSQSAGKWQHNKNIKNIKNIYNKEGEVSTTFEEWSPPPKGTPEYEAWRNQ